MWFAICITIIAASGNNIGKVLQKQATRTLPRLSLRREIITQYLQSGTWVAGMLTDLAGALLMIVAFASAPVSVVQPVSAVGLVILLVFSHFYLKERLQASEWLAAAVALCGVVGLGLSAEASHLEHPDFSAGRVLIPFLALILLLALECWWRHGASSTASGKTSSGLLPAVNPSGKHGPHMGPGGGGSGLSGSGMGGTGGAAGSGGGGGTDAVLCGLEAGACFGYSAAACRTGFILAKKLSMVWVPLGLGASVVLTSSGFVLQTRGLKSGNTVVVCTMAATSSMISGVVAGFIALDERLPTGHGLKLVRLGSWACILLGVTSLAGGADGARAAASALAGSLAQSLPPWAWRLMPRAAAVALHRSLKRLEVEGLPVLEPGAL